MNKTLMYVSISVFGFVGGYLPSLLGDTALFSGWAILGSTIGGLFGVYVAYKLTNS
jgi:hypothetical protein